MVLVMSFWPSIYSKIENQVKLVEYRRVFPKNCKYAYMYVSKPVKAICAIIYFGEMHSLEDWKEEYILNSEVSDRINSFSSNYKYAMEIQKIQKINPISLETLRENVPGFTAPQSYLLLENNKLLSDYIENNVKFLGEPIINNLENILPDHICRRY
ncbi:hypothetical protein PML89_09755 (plasmid) [Vagococcus lutrae]|uniref:hypothetical protein n=1 Tax=Vagococcus lutrae TaxID=81947 RepID=UPI00232E740B|nr:hypothetical protein [Vagococcus lutrae]WCG06112.1 hypothetical protein PML89_09755 [Vagococcus lutrae]